MAARIVGDGSPPLIVTGSDDDGSRDRGRWEFSVSDAGRQGDFVCFASGQPELLRYYRRAATAIRLVGCGDKRTAASQLRLDLGPGIPRMIVRQSHQPDKARNHDNHELAKNGETGFSCVSPRNNRGTWKCCRERANVDLVGMGKKEMCQFQDGVVQKASQTGPWLSCRHSSKPGFSTGISHSPTAWDSSGAYHCSRVPELNLQCGVDHR
jgi:hypothetical protein